MWPMWFIDGVIIFPVQFVILRGGKEENVEFFHLARHDCTIAMKDLNMWSQLWPPCVLALVVVARAVNLSPVLYCFKVLKCFFATATHTAKLYTAI